MSERRRVGGWLAAGGLALTLGAGSLALAGGGHHHGGRYGGGGMMGGHHGMMMGGEGSMMGPGMMGPMMMPEGDLPEDARTRLRELHADFAAEQFDVNLETRAAQRHFREAMQREEYDEQAVGEAYDRLAEVRKERLLSHLRFQREVMDAMPEDQRERMREQMGGTGEHRGGMGGMHHGGGMGGGHHDG